MNFPVKKLSILVLVITLLLIAAAPAMGAANHLRVFVQFSPNGKSAVRTAISQAGGEFHYTFDDLDVFVTSVPAQALRGLYRNPNVVTIAEDTPRYQIMAAPATETLAELADTIGPNGQTIPYGIDAVQARDVWDADQDGSFDPGAPTGNGVTVCIIDTGFYSAHEDLAGIPLIGGIAQVDPPYTNDGFGHGSHVAGTIAAQNNGLGVVGVSPGVSFYIVKYFGDDGAAQLFASDLIAGTNACANNGSKIISMSLGGSLNNIFEQIQFNNLYSAGILSVAAAGNAGDTSYSYPASYDSVVSVGAVDEAKNVASFSQQNNQVELAAPGVGVMSTLPFIDNTTVTVDGVDYQANMIANAPRTPATGPLVDGGICDTTGSWSGMVVLCERGAISFYDKTMNVQNSGGVAAVIYNGEPGNFNGTLGDGNSSSIIAVSLSQDDGQYLVTNKLGFEADVTSVYSKPASGYGAWNGTSMATPHVSAVAALLWSAFPSATNAEIRDAMNSTAFDLGPTGRDNAYGYGLVQANDALAYLGGGNTPPTVTITAPPDGSSFEVSETINFTGTATDTEDGDLSATISWASDLDGPLGTGASLSTTLSEGTHTITASVTDSGGLAGSDSITVTITSQPPDNTPPTVTITAPAAGASFEVGEMINFTGTATDTEDGDLSAAISWASDLDGPLGTGASLSTTLSAGTHTITASTTDSGGLEGSDSITVTVTDPSQTNTPPTVGITSPPDGTMLEFFVPATFTGTATDAEDGDLSASISWTSDLNGNLGTGASITTATLYPGVHIITASVTDSGGLEGSDSISVYVNTRPAVTILDPSVDPYPVNFGTPVLFTAYALDAEELDISDRTIWSSDLDGSLGTGASISVELSAGTHTVTASASDSDGFTGINTVTVIVNGPPTVTISAPSDGSIFDTNDVINFAGSASDAEDGDLSASISWTSDLDGSLGSGAGITATLSLGTHTITANVTDSGGLQGADSITVVVTEPDPALFVTVTTDKPTYTKRDRVKINVSVTDGSAPVANANVTTTITTATNNQKVYTGTTDANGIILINYKFNIRKDGTGTYLVDAAATLTGYIDGFGTTTFEVQ